MSPTSCTITTQLNQEWEDIRWTRAEWLNPSPTLDEVLTSIRFNPDRVLTELVMAFHRGYNQAGRVVVQALLPKLILMSRSYPYPRVEHLASALWIRISTYPLDRRPVSVAANLVLDAKKDVLWEDRAIPTLPVATATTHDVTADQVLATARSLHIASEESLSIVEKVYVDQLPRTELAHLLDMTDQALRRRCSDTVRRLRDHRELLAA